MGLYQYGVGGNEVKVDANESIAEIPSNRTLFVQKLTDITLAILVPRTLKRTALSFLNWMWKKSSM